MQPGVVTPQMSSLMDLVAQNQPRFETHQALLVIGMQNDFLLPDGRLPVQTKTGFLERIQTLIPKFRELNGNVIWVQTLYETDRIANDADTGEGDSLVVGGLVDGEESGDEAMAKGFKELPPPKSSKHKKRAMDLLKRVSARRKTIPREVARATAERDDELFLLKTDERQPACIPETQGSQFSDVIARQFELPADMVLRTTNYSAFQGTNLLITLRARLVTELYICGCITNISILATVIDAARHGVKINVVEDCLGFRKQHRHALALRRMDEFFDAYIVNSTEILARDIPSTTSLTPSSPNGSRKDSTGNDKTSEAVTSKKQSTEEGRPSSRTSTPRSPKVLSGGKQRTLSLVSFAEERRANQNAAAPLLQELFKAPITESTEKAASETTRSIVEETMQQPSQDPVKKQTQEGAKTLVNRPVKEPIRETNAETAKEPTKEQPTSPIQLPTDREFTAMLVKGATVPRPTGDEDLVMEADHEKPEKAGLVKSKIRMRSKPKKKLKEQDTESSTGVEHTETTVQTSNNATAEPATAAAKNAPHTRQEPRRLLTKVKSIAGLRDKQSKQQQLKSVPSLPVLSADTVRNSEEKERHRLSDLSGRVRLSFSRASKSDDSRKGLGILGSSREPKSPTKSDTYQSKKSFEQSSIKSLSSSAQADGRFGSVTVPLSPATTIESQNSRRITMKPSETTTARSPLPSHIARQASVSSKSVELATSTEGLQSPASRSSSICARGLSTESPPVSQKESGGALPVRSKEAVQSTPVSESDHLAPVIKSSTLTKTQKQQSLANLAMVSPGAMIAAGDSRIIHDFFPPDFCHLTEPSKPVKDVIFTQLHNEVCWQKMWHRTGEVPRLVCCQGAFGDDGSIPVYRHPTDRTLPLLHFSPKVQMIRRQAEKLVGHSLNHVLIQLYRSGNDFISEHSDKTLDIVKGSSIVNVSFGAQRTMRLRTKKASSAKPKDNDTEECDQRDTQRVVMPHNSMFVLGLESNEQWLHGIMADKRPAAERHELEEAYGGARISLTFRNIGTFLDARQTTIWGQGATGKDWREATEVVNGDEEENKRLISAFSKENHSADFAWDEHYGDGFDVLHIQQPPQHVPILFASTNSVETRQVQMCLAEVKLTHTVLAAHVPEAPHEGERTVIFRDNDAHHTEISNSEAILFYLDRYHPLDKSDAGKPCTAASHSIMRMAVHLLICWGQREASDLSSREEVALTMAILEERLLSEGGPYIAGHRFSIADCYVWPLLDELIEKWEGWSVDKFPSLNTYYQKTWKKKSSAKKIKEN